MAPLRHVEKRNQDTTVMFLIKDSDNRMLSMIGRGY